MKNILFLSDFLTAVSRMWFILISPPPRERPEWWRRWRHLSRGTSPSLIFGEVSKVNIIINFVIETFFDRKIVNLSCFCLFFILSSAMKFLLWIIARGVYMQFLEVNKNYKKFHPRYLIKRNFDERRQQQRLPLWSNCVFIAWPISQSQSSSVQHNALIYVEFMLSLTASSFFDSRRTCSISLFCSAFRELRLRNNCAISFQSATFTRIKKRKINDP